MPSCQLGSLPDAIGNLINLEVLNVKENALTSLPDAIGNLINLKTSYIGSNALTSLPDAIGNLRRMKNLYLFNNQLTEILDTLGENLLDLEYLQFYNNNLESIPQSFENLKKLRSLDLGGNRLITLPNIFEKMTVMKSGARLHIYDNPTMTSLPDSIRFIKNALNNVNGSCTCVSDHAPLLALVDLKYQRWCDRKPLLLMKPKKGVDLKKYAAMYEVLLARLDARYGDPARSFTLVQHIASFLGPRPNHVTKEAIAAYRK